MTAYKTLTGKDYKDELLRIGEACFFRAPEVKHKLDTPWSEGVWVGRTEDSNVTLR